MIYLILLAFPLLTLLWLGWAWWQLRRIDAAGVRWIRWGCGATIGVILATYVWVVGQRMDLISTSPPPSLQALLLMWVIVFLPFLALPMIFGVSLVDAGRAIARWMFGASERRSRVAGRHAADSENSAASPEPGAVDVNAGDGELASASGGMSRRQMLRTATLALPVFGTLGATGISIPQKTRFRVRHIDVPLANLPRALDGATITHISDTHVGKFTRGRVLKDLAETVNELKSDLVLLTGDLIDHSVADLPEALDMIERFNPGRGLFNIEGNHDLFDGAAAFVQGHTQRGVPLLRANSARLRLNGHPLEILGASWNRREADMAREVAHLASQADPDAFPILLAHHPHAFDTAVEHGIGLTLAGHTHGGQLMLTPEIGPGAMMYRYWSGLYQQNDSALVVSNGAGNWFPLRTAAPAEVLQLTLRRV